MKRNYSVSSAWIPEDDLLLQNSIEAGASLEALAKGAIKFSRGFTLHELRDRWHSLLYDPAVSAQASVRMIGFEHPGSNPSLKFSRLDGLKGNEKSPGEKKGGSIRRQYYAMRKRIRNEFFNSPDLGFFEKCNYHDYSRHEHNFQDHVMPNHEAQIGDAMFGDCLANNLGFEETDFEILRQAFPETIGSIATTAVDELVDAFHTEGCHDSIENDYINVFMRQDGLYKVTENVRPLLRNDFMGSFDPVTEPKNNSPVYDAAQSVSLLGDKPDETDFINSSAVSEGEYSDLPDSRLNFTNECDILYMDVVAKDTTEDISISQLLDSPNNVPEDAPNTQCHEELKAFLFHGDQQDVFHWEADVPSTSISHSDSLQLSEGKIICTLNTEDPEIPCNGDIFLLIHPSTSFAPSVRPQIASDSIDPLSSSADEKDGEQGSSAAKDPAPSFTQSQMAGPNLSSEFDSEHPHFGYAFKSSDAKSLHPLFGQPDMIRNHGQSRSMHTNPVLIGDRLLTEDGLDTLARYSERSLCAEVGSLKMIDPESMDNPSVSGRDNSDSDDDLPCFSDIEAMILEMDLAYVQESCITSEVARHQYNHSKSTIIRLEQTAHSSLQRAMSSLGAFAIFYGRHFKYYIKKTEVIIGRSTDDTDVDIDLRKEGRANMISRQQATIKMGTDGSFSLKNLGKSSISMNGNSIARGQVAALSSSCLIEIRGMSFMFEINHRYVRRYLDNIINKSQGKSRTFEWSSEAEP